MVTSVYVGVKQQSLTLTSVYEVSLRQREKGVLDTTYYAIIDL